MSLPCRKAAAFRTETAICGEAATRGTSRRPAPAATARSAGRGADPQRGGAAGGVLLLVEALRGNTYLTELRLNHRASQICRCTPPHSLRAHRHMPPHTTAPAAIDSTEPVEADSKDRLLRRFGSLGAEYAWPEFYR